MDTISVKEQDNCSSHHEVEVFCQDIEEPAWLGNIEPFVTKVLDHQNYQGWNISVVFCSDNYIRNLNRDFRNRDSATDVLSFVQIENPAALPAAPFYAGDIVISLETLAENSSYFEIDEEEELKRVLIHGILHLAGWTHSDTDQRMLHKQEHIVSVFIEENIY